MTLASGTRLGPYEIVAAIGAGGMGEVYRARDTKLDREVAIKILPELFAADAERVARFEREAKTLAALNHPHIAQIHGLEDSTGVRALVMELVEGPTLADRLAHGPLPFAEALPIARQIAEALESAHELGIIHRDLKPANVKVREDGTVKVLDFGLAKALAADPAADPLGDSPTMTSPFGAAQGGPAMTRAGVILGTAAYMSPEQARGAAVDKRADIWAFGVVLFEMLTGRAAFPGDTITDVLAAIVHKDPDWSALPAATPPRVRELLERCLAKDRKQRLHDMGDARLELAKGLAGGAEVAAQFVSGAPHAAGVSKREIAAWALATLALIAVAWVWVGGTGRQAVTDQPTFSYLLPPADSVACFWDGFAVSPDGRKIAFSSLSSKGERLVWVRDLGRAESVPLTGTNGALYPFWSPDSKSIGFYSNGELKRISADGGPVLPLCRASMQGGSASWGRTGTIIFYSGTGLARVSENGGEPASIPGSAGSSPSFLGDEDEFVFRRRQDTNRLAFTASARQPDRQTIIKGITDVDGIQWAGADWLMLHRSRESTLLVQRVDLAKSEAMGRPTLIAERVPGPNAVPAFSVSPGGLAAFVVNRPEARNDSANRLIWVDRRGSVVGTLGDPGGFWFVRISHGGRQVAVTPDNDTWVYDVATGMQNRVTWEMARGLFASSPVWSWRDDHVLASVSTRGGADGLREYSVSGGQARDLDITYNALGGVDWSRDGRYVLISRYEEGSDMSDLAYYDFNDKRLRPLLSTPAYEGFGALSPDGHWIAYVSNATGPFEVYVQPFPGGGKVTRVSFAGGMHPRWRGDGNELFFLAPDWTVMAAEVKLQWPWPPSAGQGHPARRPHRHQFGLHGRRPRVRFEQGGVRAEGGRNTTARGHSETLRYVPSRPPCGRGHDAAWCDGY